MSFHTKEPILVIGLGGVGARLATDAREILGNADCAIVSNDAKDLEAAQATAKSATTVRVSTGSVINPSVQMIRGSTYGASKEIRDAVRGHATIVMIGNLAGRAGAAMAPVVSEICREEPGAKLVSFVVMPFGYEKCRVFDSGVSLKRVRQNSDCTVVLDNDALLESNPELGVGSCYKIANSAIMHAVKSLGTAEIHGRTNILATSKRGGQDMEESLRDSLKMLYENAPPSAVKRAMVYVLGGSDVPVGMLNAVASMAEGIVGDSRTQADMDVDESGIVMLSSIRGMTKFDRYDPLGVIPKEKSLDLEMPECSFDCKLDLYQLE